MKYRKINVMERISVRYILSKYYKKSVKVILSHAKKAIGSIGKEIIRYGFSPIKSDKKRLRRTLEKNFKRDFYGF